MDVREAKRTAREWVEANRERWPGLRAAHLVGGITDIPDDASFPAYKDVDLHLVVDAGSPLLRPSGPIQNLIEEEYAGILIEAGIKPVSDYASAEAVLANPEIAYHLTRDCVLHDPDELLRALQEPVRREYARRQWVKARVDYERAGLAGTMAMLPMARAMGPSGEMSLLGYSFTYATAALGVAALQPPSIGSRMALRLRAHLAEHGRPELYEEFLAVLGLRDITPEQVEHFLVEGSELFDRAVRVKRTPHPFGHKLHAHLRPYFVDSCRAMLDEGHHREALSWITPFLCSSVDVIVADGPAVERPAAEARRDTLLRALGMGTDAERAAKLVQGAALHDACFALAGEVVARHPAIVE